MALPDAILLGSIKGQVTPEWQEKNKIIKIKKIPAGRIFKNFSLSIDISLNVNFDKLSLITEFMTTSKTQCRKWYW